jgi:hypothetical protein
MKKVSLLLSGALLFFAACQKNNNNDVIADDEINMATPNQRQCASDELMKEQMQNDPGFARKLEEIEAFTQRFAKDPNARLLSNGIIEIPVVVNVLYKTSAQNISLAQIQSQIDVLNEDFAATNADYNTTPALFQPVRSGDIGIRFVLDQVIRKQTNKSSWQANDAMKKSNQGGIDPTSPTTKLNLWVCNLASSLLGYAQFPGGAAATDGVVCDDNATGRTGTAAAPFNKGRTATHEVGHWMNLRHIWGDATCGNDLVGDTPQHNASNGGCPAYPHYSTCSGTPVEMTMNYMDYTYDACMYMFSAGQKTRMLAVFATGGPRNSFAQP